MKVAINKCFGGFSLSDKAIEMIMKRKGFGCFRYKQTKYDFQDGKDEYKKYSASEVQNDPSGLFIGYYTTDYGDVVSELPDDSYWTYNDLKRTDTDMISVIEELGEEESSGRFGAIKIVEIPDDVEWVLDEYDGIESIHEKHRVWY